MLASAFVGTSLDGFIARRNGALDFLEHGGNEPHGYEEFTATVDTMVLGRKTYETVLGFGGWAYGPMPVFVLSYGSPPPAPEGAAVEFLSGPPGEIVAALDRRGFRHAYVDGGVTVQGFLAAGALQRLIVTRLPVLIGEGMPLFGKLRGDVLLRHIATRTFRGGLVQSEYHIGDTPDLPRLW